MANTLKFGSGQWGTKVGSALAYNDEDGNFKPLPFNFTRSTSATRINKDGLIEVVTNNKPRIDFLNDSNGVLLLEPSRTNLITYSEDFTEWSTNATITPNSAISPDGTQNATLFSHSGGSFPQVASSGITFVSGANYTPSLYVKSDGTNQVQHSLLVNNVVVNFTPTDEWVRISDLIVSPDTSGSFVIAQNSGSAVPASFYIWGAQLEAGSYATSYIPTQGAISTRVGEVCSQTPPSGIIGQTEGTIFFNADVSNTFGVQLGNSSGVGDFVNSIQIAFGSVSTNVNVFNGGAAQFSYSGVVNTGVKKVALTYKKNDFAFYIDGNQIITDNLGTIPSISGIFFNHQNLGTTKGLLTDLKIYNTRLSNSELQALTS